MELVPIVITSLEIVLALAIITFVVSYISYKIKSKVSPEQFEPGQDMKPRFATRRFNRLTYITKEIIHVSKPKEAPPVKMEKQPKPQPPAEKITPKKETAPSAKRTKTANESKQNRLEIVRNLSPEKDNGNDKKNGKPETSRDNLKSLDDDILNKYVDDENHPLFSLKTNKNESKE